LTRGGRAVNKYEPSITSDQARLTALTTIFEVYQIDSTETIVEPLELRIYHPALFGFSDKGNYLVWKTEITPAESNYFREYMIVDAQLNTIALHFNQVETALKRMTYMRDKKDNTIYQILMRMDEQDPSGDSDCDNAHDYAKDTYNFYKKYHGRDSIDNRGMAIVSIVTTLKEDFKECNAAWNSKAKELWYADGCSVTADDVVAHEWTHGVTQHESHLIYYNQSGAINESFSDIWGEFVDQTNGKGNDSAAVRWILGEDIQIGHLRNMKNPPAFNHPDMTVSPLYYCGNDDNGGVHTNCGVSNKAAYLMTDGGVYNGSINPGLGYLKVSKLFYEVQNNIVSSANYNHLYNALLLACNNLRFAQSEIQTVKNALDAVYMYLPPCQPEYPTIAGYVKDSDNNPISGVEIKFTKGMGGATTNTIGFYSRKVSYKWSGTAVPVKNNYIFEPTERSYSSVTSNLVDQNYIVISTNCTYNISPMSVIIKSSGGAGNVSIITQNECEWHAINNDPSWITVTSYLFTGVLRYSQF
jgi:hypothetical protein